MDNKMSLKEATNELSKLLKSPPTAPKDTTPFRPFDAYSPWGGRRSRGLPPGVTKVSMTEGLMKAVQDGALDVRRHRELAPWLDVRDLGDIWRQLDDEVRKIILEG